MNVNQISVANTATLIVAANTSRTRLKINVKSGSGVCYIGGDNSVTTSNGYPIGITEYIELNDYTGAVYGVVAASTDTVDYLEEV